MKIFSIDNSKYLLKLLPSYSDLFLDDTCAFLKNSLYLQQNYLLANSLPTYSKCKPALYNRALQILLLST